MADGDWGPLEPQLEGDETPRPGSRAKQGKIVVQPGQPLQFTDVVDVDTPNVRAASIRRTIGETLTAYKEAARKLLEGKYAAQRDLAPPHMQGPCSIFVLRCHDGIFVRYDLVSQGDAKTRCAELDTLLSEVAPHFSEGVIHFPKDPNTYVPSSGGPEISLQRTDATGGATEIDRFRPLIYAKTTLPKGFQTPAPPARPPCLVAIQNDFWCQMHGVVAPGETPPKLAGPDVEQFIAHSRFRLNVGWQTIEIYPPLGDEHWKPEYAPMWAEIDLLATIVQKNLTTSTLSGLDSRAEIRKRYAALLDKFDALLVGPEEPVHQFLKQHPELLCPTNDRYWSKLPFGDRVSDFVFREPYNDYQLVEIEAPIRKLFRKNGQQREELTHAINQIMDWIQYIANNKQRVEEEFGLVGISTNPHSLVVIGRSSSLTEENRRKLATLQAQQNKMRILTYDDVIAAARANLERLLGPLTLKGENAELYFFKEPLPSTKKR
jgi:hypothetical protein